MSEDLGRFGRGDAAGDARQVRELDHGTPRRQLAHVGERVVGSDERLERVRHHHLDAERPRRVHDRELLGQIDVTRRHDGLVIAREPQDLLHRRDEPPGPVEERQPRSGEPELPAHAS